jgi:hypothetical protein
MVAMRVLVGLLLVLMGLWLGWTALHGLGTGEIPEISKNSHAIILRAHDATRFWITVSGWAVLSSLLIAGGVGAVKRGMAS